MNDDVFGVTEHSGDVLTSGGWPLSTGELFANKVNQREAPYFMKFTSRSWDTLSRHSVPF